MQRIVILFLVACGSSAPKQPAAPTPAPTTSPAPVAAQPAPPKQECTDLESCRDACGADDANACERGTEIAFELSKGQLEYAQAMAIVGLFADRGCKLGNPRTCTILGALLADGRGVPKDEARSLEMYVKGCEGGDAEGCTSVGFTLAEAKNIVEARKYYERACELGSGRGCRWLGMQHAESATPDKAKALAYLAKGCAAKDTLSCSMQRDVETRLYPLQRAKFRTFSIGHEGLQLSKATRSKAEAKKLADTAVRELGRGGKFEAIAKKYGDPDLYRDVNYRESELFRHDLTGADPKAAEWENKLFGLKAKTAYASENPSFGYVIFYRL